MYTSDYFYLGTIVGKFSYKGEVLIKLDTDTPEKYIEEESVFVDIRKNLIPFFIEKSQLQKTSLLRVKFEEINSETDAEELIKKDVYLPLSRLPELKNDQFYYHEVIGYTMFDKDFGEIGKLTAVNDHGAQALFIIQHQHKEVLVPINDDFITKIDKEKEEFHLQLPEGLLDLYIGKSDE